MADEKEVAEKMAAAMKAEAEAAAAAANATNWPVIGLAVAAIAGGAFYYLKNAKN